MGGWTCGVDGNRAVILRMVQDLEETAEAQGGNSQPECPGTASLPEILKWFPVRCGAEATPLTRPAGSLNAGPRLLPPHLHTRLSPQPHQMLSSLNTLSSFLPPCLCSRWPLCLPLPKPPASSSTSFRCELHYHCLVEVPLALLARVTSPRCS